MRRQSGGAGYQNLGPAQHAKQDSFVGLSTEMHDLRQRHCPISASTDIVVTRRGRREAHAAQPVRGQWQRDWIV